MHEWVALLTFVYACDIRCLETRFLGENGFLDRLTEATWQVVSLILALKRLEK